MEQTRHAVTIEPLPREAFATVAVWLSSPPINSWLTSEWRNAQVAPPVLAMLTRKPENRLFLVRSAGQPVGLVALARVDEADRCAELWYLLGDHAHAGKGVTTDAVRLLVTHAFGEMKLATLYAWAFEPNTPSRKLLERVGFKHAGRLRHGTTVGGELVDRLLYELIADELTDDASG